VRTFAAFQVVLLAGALFTTGLLKVAAADPRALAERAFLTRRLRPQQGEAIWYGIGSLEICLAAGLPVVPSSWLRELVFAVAFAATIYSSLALRYAPESTCGCLGSTEAISWRAPARALFLAAAAWVTIAYGARLGDIAKLDSQEALALLGEAAVLVFLFKPVSSSRAAWFAVRFRQPRCLTNGHTIEWALDQLHHTRLWEQFTPSLISRTPVDHWREGCWRLVSYDSEDAGGPGTVVFAIRLPPGGRHFRGAIIAEGAEEPSSTATESWSRWQTWRRRFVEAGFSFPSSNSVEGLTNVTVQK
jgi:hypothetical protein